MQIREVISQADHQALCEYLVTIEQKYETIYRNGKSNNFFYGTDEFRDRYNAVKDKYDGCDGEEMMELYPDISLYKIVRAMSYLLEREEYIMFARCFHYFNPPSLIAFAKGLLGSRPDVFEILCRIHDRNGLSITQMLYGLVFHFWARVKEDRSLRFCTAQDLLNIEECVSVVGDHSSLFVNVDLCEHFESRFRREKRPLLFYKLDKFYALDRFQEEDVVEMESQSSDDLSDDGEVSDVDSVLEALDNISDDDAGQILDLCVDSDFGQEDFYE